MSRIILFFLFCFFSPHFLSAQGGNVFMSYDLAKTGCDLPGYEDYLPGGSHDLSKRRKQKEIIYRPPTPPPPPAGPVQKIQLASFEVFEAFQKELPMIFQKLKKEQEPTEAERRIELTNGHYAYWEKEQWGIKNAEDKIVLEPTFKHIIPDTIAKGFMGYIGATCSYYSSEGKAIINTPFYSISPVNSRQFIVQSKTGYGLVNEKDILIEPNCKLIKHIKGAPDFFKVKDKNGVELLYLEDGKTSIAFPVFDKKDIRIYGDQYFWTSDQLIDIQNKKRLFSCSEDYGIDVIDFEKRIYKLVRKDKRRRFFKALFDQEGNIIKQDSFSSVNVFDKNGLAVAYSTKKVKLPKIPRPVFPAGLINKDFEWVLEPAYKAIHLKENYYLLDRYFLRGAANKHGKLIIPAEYSKTIVELNGKQLFASGGLHEAEAKLIDIETGEIIKDKMPFQSYKSFEFCGEEYYMLNIDGSNEQIVHKDFSPFTKAHKYIHKWRDCLIAEDYKMLHKDTSKLYNCAGDLVTFNIGDREISSFKKLKSVVKDLNYIELNDGNTFLWKENGLTIPLDYRITGYSIRYANYLNLAILPTDNGMRMVDPNGASILPYFFNHFTVFDPVSGLGKYTASLKKDGAKQTVEGYIDYNGNFIFKGRYEYMQYLGFGLFKARKNGMWGVIDRNNKIILPYNPDPYRIQDGLIILESEYQKRKVYDILGNLIH